MDFSQVSPQVLATWTTRQARVPAEPSTASHCHQSNTPVLGGWRSRLVFHGRTHTPRCYLTEGGQQPLIFKQWTQREEKLRIICCCFWSTVWKSLSGKAPWYHNTTLVLARLGSSTHQFILVFVLHTGLGSQTHSLPLTSVFCLSHTSSSSNHMLTQEVS